MAEDADLLAALDTLTPSRGPMKTTCAFLMGASPEVLESIRRAFQRGNSYTSIANRMRKSGALVTLPGIRDHFNSECETCRISLTS